MGETYFLITWEEDGVRIEQMGKEQLTRELAEGDIDGAVCLKGVPSCTNTAYWGEGGALIIKGSIIVPKPVKVVETYTID